MPGVTFDPGLVW